jgi:hypothetical protein
MLFNLQKEKCVKFQTCFLPILSAGVLSFTLGCKSRKFGADVKGVTYFSGTTAQGAFDRVIFFAPISKDPDPYMCVYASYRYRSQTEQEWLQKEPNSIEYERTLVSRHVASAQRLPVGEWLPWRSADKTLAENWTEYLKNQTGNSSAIKKSTLLASLRSPRIVSDRVSQIDEELKELNKAIENFEDSLKHKGVLGFFVSAKMRIEKGSQIEAQRIAFDGRKLQLFLERDRLVGANSAAGCQVAKISEEAMVPNALMTDNHGETLSRLNQAVFDATHLKSSQPVASIEDACPLSYADYLKKYDPSLHTFFQKQLAQCSQNITAVESNSGYPADLTWARFDLSGKTQGQKEALSKDVARVISVALRLCNETNPPLTCLGLPDFSDNLSTISARLDVIAGVVHPEYASQFKDPDTQEFYRNTIELAKTWKIVNRHRKSLGLGESSKIRQ